MVVDALIGAIWMILMVASALAVGIILGKLAVHMLKRQRDDAPTCEVSDHRIEELSLSILRIARNSRIESERLDRDLRGAANV